jgi:hypothetical protein
VGAEQLRVTELLKPPRAATARLKTAVPPAETEAVEGVGVSLKSGAAGAQDGKLKEAILVDQMLPVVGMYAVV